MYVLFPGRHLVQTRFQEDYLIALLSGDQSAPAGIIHGKVIPQESPREVIFAITSSNQENSRYNPIPFYIRAIGVDRFARSIQQSANFRYRIFGIPHYGQTPNFASFTLKEIAEQSEGAIQLTPSNAVVLCSTEEIIRQYQGLGFSIAPGELLLEAPNRVLPIDVIAEVGRAGAGWISNEQIRQQISDASLSLFTDFPEVPQRISRLYRDPL